jgi:hypothetical protein
VTTTDTKNDNIAILQGFRWALNLSAGGKDYTFSVSRPMGQTETFNPKFTGGPDGTTVTFAVTPGVFTWRIPRKGFDGMKPGGVVTVKSASTGVGSFNADAATSLKNYTDLTPSCVKAS